MSEEIKFPAGTVFLKNVRLAFPELFVAKQFKGEGAPKYSATFLIEPDSQNDKNVRQAIAEVARAQWEEKTAATLKTIEGQPMKYAYVRGDLRAYDGFEGKMALSAKRKEDDGPVMVLDRDASVLTREHGRPYGGCYVHARVQLWAQQNEWGVGMRATIVVVQFVNDGDSFGGAPQATAVGFSAIEDEAADLV